MARTTTRPARLGHLLIGLGAALIAFALMWALVFFPQQLMVPLSVNTQVTATGRGDVLDFASLDSDQLRVDTDVPLRYTQYTVGVEPGDSDVMTAQIGTTIIRTDRAGTAADGGAANATGVIPDDALVQASVQRTTINRKTAMPVDDAGNTAIQNAPDAPSHPVHADGITIAWPVDTQRQSYPFFDPIVERAAPMDYVGDVMVGDLHAYRFSQTLRDEDLADVDPSNEFTLPAASLPPSAPAALRDKEGDVTMRLFYSVERTYDVEPRTGQILAATEKIHQYLGTRPGEVAVTVFRMDVTLDEQSVQTLSAGAKSSLDDMSRYGTWMPWVTGIIGALAVVGGGIVLARRGR